MQQSELIGCLEAILFAAGKPLDEKKLLAFFDDDNKPALADVRQALHSLQEDYKLRGIELIEVASGYRFQTKQSYAKWVMKLWEEKPTRYSRALLETLALVAYRQPITRGEIEEIRGVSTSSTIFKTLDERGWITVIGHKEVPGRPGMYATTKEFLDYFNFKSLEELPTLPEIMSLTQEISEPVPNAD